MCGICGFFQNNLTANLDTLKGMNDKIIHRGPDDDGYYYNKKVGLAARRLSIIDLETGHQPLSTYSKKHWITYNGEIYNYKELRKELLEKGYKFNTQCDTEVIVTLYEEHGKEFVKKLRGMFAFAIYDIGKDELLLARDHIGIKPLHYYHDKKKDIFVFGSEIKSILEFPSIPRNLNKEGLDLFLTLEYYPAPYTAYQKIFKLPPGHILIYKNNNTKIEKYWELKENLIINNNFNQLKEKFINLMEECVKMRLISDVPLGSFLSGGLDSSSIVAFMHKLKVKDIKTFSIGFNEQSYNELKYSDKVAKKFKTTHYTEILSPNIISLFNKLNDILDEPLGDFSNFPTFLVSQKAKENVTVALSGDGGDEIFGGYEHYIAQKTSSVMNLFPLKHLHKLFAQFNSIFPPAEKKKGIINKIKRFSEGFENSYADRHFRWMIFLSNAKKQKLYSKNMLQESFLLPLNQRKPFNDYFKESLAFSSINKDLYLDFKSYMVDNILVKVDRMSMVASLEARVPILDYKMVEFAFSLPPSYKLKGNCTKWFFKECMRGILPDEIIFRKKEGFSIPIKNWLKAELKDLMLEYLSEKKIKESGLFNYNYINQMIDEHLKNKENHAHRLWSLILFNRWLEKYNISI